MTRERGRGGSSGPALVLIWAASAGVASELLEPELAIRIVRCSPRRLEATTLEAARGAAVVAVVDTPEQVEQALRCGADEALTLDDLSRDTFGASLARAALRREGRERSVEAVRQSLYGPGATMFDLFGEALATSIAQPLRAATAQLQVFRDALSTGADEQRARPESRRGDSNRPSRTSDPGRLVDDPLGLIRTALDSIERLQGVLLEAPVEIVDAREVVENVAALIAPVVERVAEFSVDVSDEECWVCFPRRDLVQILTAALHGAVLNVTRKGGDRFVEISLQRQQGTALVEVLDDGDTATGPIPRPWLPRAAAAGLHDPSAVAIALAATRLRQAGGELLVDVHPGEGTTMRIFLPRAKRPTPRASEASRPRR